MQLIYLLNIIFHFLYIYIYFCCFRLIVFLLWMEGAVEISGEGKIHFIITNYGYEICLLGAGRWKGTLRIKNYLTISEKILQ